MDKNKLDSLFSEIQEPVILTNRQGQVTFFNAFARQFFSYTNAESAYPSLFSLFNASIHKALRTFMADEYTTNPDVYEAQTLAYTRQATPRPVGLLVSRVSQQREPIFLILLSPLASLDTALIQSIHYLPDALLLLDAHLRIIDANDQALRLLAVQNKTALVGQPLHFYWKEAREDILKHHQREEDVQLTKHHQETFWANVSLAEWPSDPPLWLLRISDATERRATEQRLILEKEQAEQAMKARENFLSLMSHEIRTPLNAMLGITHLMLESEPREDQKELLQTLEFSSNNLNTLVNDILSYAKSGSGAVTFEQKPFNLLEFVHGIKLTYKSLANAKGVTFRLLLEDEAPETVVGDVNRLGQILNNLLNNAVKFTQSGQVVLSLYIAEAQEEQYQLLFEVADTGIGVPEDKLSAIFDPYQQADEGIAQKFGGTGLGLSIVKNLVQLQGGKVEVNSTVGQGTTFKVQLPFAKPSAETLRQENTPRQLLSEYQSLEGFKVLYVEDVVPNQLLMEGLSNKWNINLDTALNGLEALEKVKQHQYDLILMDIHMPEMDGYETTAEIRKLHDPHYANIPIVALTASVSENTQDRVQALGMNDYISKPIDPQDLHQKLYKFSQVETKASDTNTTASESANAPDFTQLRDLFINDTSGYTQLLTQVRELMLEARRDMAEAIQEKQQEKLRLSMHKIVSYVRLLKLDQFNQLLTRARSYVEDQEKVETVEELIQELNTHFDTAIEALRQELASHPS